MDVLENLKQSIQLLDEIENSFDEFTQLHSQVDKKISFWMHYLELNNIPVTQSYKIIKELQALRRARRKYKNNIEIVRLFKSNSAKLCNINNRKMLLSQICNLDKHQQNAKYNYDAYSKEEINELLGVDIEL